MPRFVDNLAERVTIVNSLLRLALSRKLRLKLPVIMTSVTSLSKARSIDSSFFFSRISLLEFGGL